MKNKLNISDINQQVRVKMNTVRVNILIVINYMWFMKQEFKCKSRFTPEAEGPRSTVGLKETQKKKNQLNSAKENMANDEVVSFCLDV